MLPQDSIVIVETPIAVKIANIKNSFFHCQFNTTVLEYFF